MLKILFLDDNHSFTRLFSCLAEDYAFEALVANSIDAGISEAKLKQPDLIITDLYMPDGDGFMLTAKLKTDPLTKHIPVVACSVTFYTKGERIFLLGGVRFIGTKPYSIEALNEMLQGLFPPIEPLPPHAKG